VTDSAFDPRRTVLLESAPEPAPVESDASGSATVSDLSTDAIEIRADVREPALLLITDGYSSGWKVRPLPDSVAQRYTIMPADYVVQAIPLAAGTHHLRLEYRPTAFVVGKWITIVSLLGYGVALAWSRAWARS